MQSRGDFSDVRTRTIPGALAFGAQAHANRPFLRESGSHAWLSFAAAWDQFRALARGFAALGVKRGDYVPFMLPNSADFVLAWFDINLRAAAYVSVNTSPSTWPGPHRPPIILARDLARTCAATGFFVLTEHGIPNTVVTDAQEAARAFFNLMEWQKGEVVRTPPVFNRGWIPPQTESLGATLGTDAPRDLKESFTLGPPEVPDTSYYTCPDAFSHFARNVWPLEPAALRPALTRYFRAVEALATELIRLFALGLDLPEHWFDDKIGRQCGSLRALFYPP